MNTTQEELKKEVKQITQNLEKNSHLMNHMKMQLTEPSQEIQKSLSISDDFNIPILTPLRNNVVISHIKIDILIDKASNFLSDKDYKVKPDRLVFQQEENAKQMVALFDGHDGAQLRVEEEQSVYFSLLNNDDYNYHQNQNMFQQQQDQTILQQPNMFNFDPNFMFNIMYHNPLFKIHPSKNFFIRKSKENTQMQEEYQQSYQEEKITIQKKQPWKSKNQDGPIRKSSTKSNKKSSVVYYDELENKKKEEVQAITIKIELDQNFEEKFTNKNEYTEVRIDLKYSLNQMVSIFKSFDKKQLKVMKSLKDFSEEQLINHRFQTLECIQPSQITEEMKKMSISCTSTPQQVPNKRAQIN